MPDPKEEVTEVPEPKEEIVKPKQYGLFKELPLEAYAHLSQTDESYQDEIYRIMLNKCFEDYDVPLTINTINILNIDQSYLRAAKDALAKAQSETVKHLLTCDWPESFSASTHVINR